MKKALELKKNVTITKGDKANKKVNTWVFISILIVIFLICYGKIFDPKLDMNGDNYSYLSLSNNIVNGHGYSSLAVDGVYKPTGWFPPGYPYILAFAQFIIGDSVLGFKVLNGLFFLLSGILFFFITKKFSRDHFFAFSISLLLLINSGLLRLSTIVMSEIPYLFFVSLAIYSLLKLDDEKKNIPFWKSRWFYLIAISSIMSYYIRGFGITLILAITLHWLVNKKWKLSAAYLLTNILLYLPYFIRNKVYGIEGRYTKMILVDNPWRPEEGGINSFSEFWDKILTNLNDTIIYGFPKVIFPSINNSEQTTYLMLFGIAVIILSSVGVWSVKKYRYFLGGFLIFNIGILLLWHTGNGVRYVWPLTGIIMFTSFFGLYNIILKLLKQKKQQVTLINKYLGLTILFCSIFHFSNITKLESQAKAKLPSAYENYFKIAKALKRKNEDIVVVCRKTSLLNYYSKTRTSNYKYTLDDKELIQHLIDIDADYVVLDQLGYSSTPRYLLPAIQKNKNLFNLEMHLKNPDTYLFKFDKEKARKQ